MPRIVMRVVMDLRDGYTDQTALEIIRTGIERYRAYLNPGTAKRPNHTVNIISEEITDEEIQAMHAAATKVGDLRVIGLCNRALAGDFGARGRVAKAAVRAER